MHIVIDIDNNLYTRLFDNGVDNYDDAVDMAKAIRKGTPLPKGHGRLIDADAILKEEYEKLEIGFDDYTIIYNAFVNTIKEIVNLTPTIIEADKGVKNESDNHS